MAGQIAAMRYQGWRRAGRLVASTALAVILMGASTAGAQTLLSEEFRSQIQADKD